MKDLFVDRVVFEHKEILVKLLVDLSQSKFVDLAIGDKPSDLHPNLLEYTLPVHHLVKFVLQVSLFVHLKVFLLHIFANLGQFWHNIATKFRGPLMLL